MKENSFVEIDQTKEFYVKISIVLTLILSLLSLIGMLYSYFDGEGESMRKHHKSKSSSSRY